MSNLTRELKLIYLAAPYTDSNYLVQSKRAGQAAKAAARLMSQGYHVFAPTVHGHQIDKWTHATEYDIAYSHWIATGLDFLERSELMYVLTLPGWDQSTGVKGEIALAWRLEKPIFLLDHRTYETKEYFHERARI